jgi:hypothetical protein
MKERTATLDARVLDGTSRTIMLLGGIYDGLLGLVFLVAAGPILQALTVSAPDNPIYLQLAAGLIALMGLYQVMAWRDGVVSAAGLLMLIAFKAFYVLLAVLSLSRGTLPHMLFGVFAVADLLFLLAFLSMMRTGGRLADPS